MHIKRHRCCLQGREPIMIILRVKRLDVTNRADRSRGIKAMFFTSNRIFVGNGPPIRAGHNRPSEIKDQAGGRALGVERALRVHQQPFGHAGPLAHMDRLAGHP